MKNIFKKMRYFSYLVVATMIFSVALTSCNKDDVTYIVNFNSKGGTPTPQQQTVKKGGKIEKPADPTLENYGFKGWTKTDNETSALWNFETETVTEDMTLFARWSINMYTVTFDSDGGSAVSAQKVAYGGKATKPAAPKRNEYEFVAWYREVELINEWKFEIDMVNADMTLYAKWEQNGYTVTVLSDEYGKANASVTSAMEGELITLTATANSGYRFAEWQVIKRNITLSSTTDNPATFTMPDEDVEVKAIFLKLVGLLETVILSHDNYHTKFEYEYDGQNRITKRTRYDSNEFNDWIITLNYYNAIDSIGYHDQNYIYAMGRQIRVWFSKNGNKITYFRIYDVHPVNGEFELNDQGLPVKWTYSYNHPSGCCWSAFTAFLTWQNGNLIKTEWKDEMEMDGVKTSSAGTVTYTHDDKKTPFYQCKTPKWVLWWLGYGCNQIRAKTMIDGSQLFYENFEYNENNIKTVTFDEGSAITYEYTYNHDGFPLTRTWVEGTTTFMETYTYK